MAAGFWRIGCFLVVSGWLGAAQPVMALPQPPAPTFTLNQVTGAATLDELSAALFSAVKANDFNLVSKFFPSETELKLLQKSPNKNLQALTENLAAEQIQGTFKTDFENLIQNTTDQSILWTELNLAETSPSKLRSPQTTMAPIKMYLTVGEHAAPYYLIYEAVRIKNRYYLFQHITLQKSG